MTAQFPERLHYEGQELSMCSVPLNVYLSFCDVAPGFESTCTALWRGYVGSWEILDGRLYLIELKGTLTNGDTANLATLFPDFPDRVFAHWYSGTLRIPQGKQIEYVHMGFGSKYERDLLIEIEKGVVVNTTVRENGISESANAPEGYGVAAFTTFPHRNKTEKGNP